MQTVVLYLLRQKSFRFPDNIISSKLTNMDEIIQTVISGNADIGILPQACSDKDLLCVPYLKEQLYVCLPKEHKLTEYSQLSLTQLNGFNCLLRDEIGFWTDLHIIVFFQQYNHRFKSDSERTEAVFLH